MALRVTPLQFLQIHICNKLLDGRISTKGQPQHSYMSQNEHLTWVMKEEIGLEKPYLLVKVAC